MVFVCQFGPAGLSPVCLLVSDMLEICLANAANCCNKDCTMCCHVYVVMHVKDSDLSVIRVGQIVLLTGFCLPLYSIHMLNKDVNMLQTMYNTPNYIS